MSRAIRTLVLVAATLLASAASATPVSWLLTGTLTESFGPAPNGFTWSVGDAFSTVLNFDSAAPVANSGACGSGGAGTVCIHKVPEARAVVYFSDIKVGSTVWGDFLPAPAGPANNFVYAYNNAPTGTYPSGADGYLFGTVQVLSTPNWVDYMQAAFLDPTALSLVTDGRVLPTTPDGLLSLATRQIKICEAPIVSGAVSCGTGTSRFVGTIDSVTVVPAPATAALLALGLGGLALSRRRARA